MPPETKKGPNFAIIDVETRVDAAGIHAVYGGGDEHESVRMLLDTVNAGRRITTNMIPMPFHIPISIAIGKVREDYSFEKVYTMPGENEVEIVRNFWKGVAKFVRDGGTLVTYNGRRFDMPVLELAALRYGIPIFPQWFGQYAGRYRYQDEWHFDLADHLSNFGATMLYGGLDGTLKICGLPGKGAIDGSMVQGMWEAGKLEEIHEYCRDDVAKRTYPLFLRIEHWRGRLSPQRYAELTAPQ
jgi:3'-5' exonuclease